MADTALARLVGLAGRRSPPSGQGLLLERCRSVHTFGMRFALDLVWLAGGEPVRVDRRVAPRRLRSCRRADSVIEVGAGEGEAFAAWVRRARPPARPAGSPAPTGRAPPWG